MTGAAFGRPLFLRPARPFGASRAGRRPCCSSKLARFPRPNSRGLHVLAADPTRHHPDQAEALEDQLLQLGTVSVTFMDAEDQPIFEPDLNTTPLWSHTHLLALFEADTDPDALLAHLQLLRGGDLPEHQTEVIEDQDWERSWMDNFQPMRFGHRRGSCRAGTPHRSRTRSTCCSIPAWPSAPAPTPPPRCAWNGLTHKHWTTGHCSISAAVRESSRSLACCWVLTRPWAPISIRRRWRLRATMPSAMASPRSASPSTCPNSCRRNRPTWWLPTSCRAARLTGAADHRSGQAGRQAGAVRHPRRTGRRGSRGLQRRLRPRPDRRQGRLGTHQRRSSQLMCSGMRSSPHTWTAGAAATAAAAACARLAGTSARKHA